VPIWGPANDGAGDALAATGLLRALIARADVSRDRILLIEWRSVDWQSLTFVGERHEFALRICGPNSPEIAGRLTDQLGEAQLHVPGQLVADIALSAPPSIEPDGSTLLTLEALTIEDKLP
jgi:hypothetical protein